jgi:hypothetical protein
MLLSPKEREALSLSNARERALDKARRKLKLDSVGEVTFIEGDQRGDNLDEGIVHDWTIIMNGVTVYVTTTSFSA